jgi:hypothetical protein
MPIFPIAPLAQASRVAVALAALAALAPARARAVPPARCACVVAPESASLVAVRADPAGGPPALIGCGEDARGEGSDVDPPCLPGVPMSRASGAPGLEPRPARRGPLPEGHLVPIIESGVVTLVMLGWNATIGEAEWARINADTIGRNLRSAWVVDDDAFWINQVGHPYQGIFPYSAARSAGVGFWSSTPYPFVTSAVWELVGETTPPSVNDQITTTVAGIVLGEALHRATGMILAGPRSPWRQAAAMIVAPMEAINRGLVGTEPHAPSPPSRVEFRAGALVFDPERGAPGSEGVVPEVGVRLSYGLPGDRGFHFERPFDRFELESTFSMEKDPLATVLARGVVAGTTLERERVRGLAGVSLEFDFSAVRRYSVSTSAIGVGAEGRWEVSPRIAVEGAATASAVLLGAAGYLVPRASEAPGEELRSYRMGPGGQAHLDLELHALERIAARLTARHYLVVGTGSLHGLERVSSVRGGLQVRVVGPHALGVEGVLAHHSGEAGDGAPARSETGTEIRAYYALRVRAR